MAAAIRSVYRPKERCTLPLTEELKAAAKVLRKALKAYEKLVDDAVRETTKGQVPSPVEVPDTLTELLQGFFFGCVTEMVKETEDKKFGCPVQVFMACFGYKEDDTFRIPCEVTSELAIWQFLLRCTALYQSDIAVRAKTTTSALR